MLVGIVLGFTAGFMGGWVDNVIRTLSDSVITIPVAGRADRHLRLCAHGQQIENMALLLALFCLAGAHALHPRPGADACANGAMCRWPALSGASRSRIMFDEMMPNLLPYLAASFTGNVSGAILAATGLEALGPGPDPYPHPGHDDLLCHPRRGHPARHVVVVGHPHRGIARRHFPASS